MRKGIDHFEEKRIDFLLLYTRCIKIAAARRWPIVERRGVAVVAVISPQVSITNKLFNVSQEKLSRKFDEASSLESLFLERELIYRQLVGSKDSELRTNVLITAQILVYICP